MYVQNAWRAAREVAEMLALPAPRAYGPFVVLQLDNDVSLDFMESKEVIRAQHYAFLVDEAAFDVVFQRLHTSGHQWWADPFKRQPKKINHQDGGRGLYWEGPDGHWLEIITRPYGAGS